MITRNIKQSISSGRCPGAFYINVFFLAAVATVLSFTGIAIAAQDATNTEVTAEVHTAVVREQLVTDLLMAYGRIIPAPGNTRSLAIPFECRVEKIFVTEGQQVEKGRPLIELSPSPASILMVESIENDLEAAKLRLDKVRERARMKLATASEMIQAEKEYNLALLRIKNLKAMKMAENITINSKNNEMITRLYCRPGQIAASGSPLMDIVDGNVVEAAIGVEPHDVHKLKAGQKVILLAVNRDMSPKTGIIRTVSRAVNISSRLIDVFVSLPSDSGFLINEFVRAEIVLDTRKGLVVPRSAVLPSKKGHVCFTVKNRRASRHAVRTGWQGRDLIEIYPESIKAGDKIVTVGNYELTDGMPVRVVGEDKKLSVSSTIGGESDS